MSRNTGLLLVFCLLVLTGCATAPPAVMLEESEETRISRAGVDPTRRDGVDLHTFTATDRQRTWYTYSPDAVSGPAPLVIVLHGGGGMGLFMRERGFEPIADARGFVLAYPDGWNRGWNDGRSGQRVADRAMGADDVEFLEAIIDRHVAEGVADEDRIFLAGVSNGGMMSMWAACNLSRKITAIATIIANMMADQVDNCRLASPMPILMIHADQDEIIPFGGGPVAGDPARGEVLSAADTVDFWLRANRIDSRPFRRSLPDRDPNDSTVSRSETWSGRDNVQVVAMTVEGGNHVWQGERGLPRRDNPNRMVRPSRDFNGAKVIWDFFSQY